MCTVDNRGQLPVDAVRFLGALAHNESVTFQTFDDTGQRRQNLNRVLHGSLEKHAAKLAQLNAAGAGVFVMVNAGDLKGRRKANVTAIRAYFVDLDGASLQPVLDCPVPPHITVESSPGRFHAYWRVSGAPMEDFRSVQRALAERFAGDLAVSDLPRVMRLPGYFHQKQVPVQTKVLHIIDQAPIAAAQFFQEMDLVLCCEHSRASCQELIHEGERNSRAMQFAGSMHREGLSAEIIGDRLAAWNARNCMPPLTEAELNAVVSQVRTFKPEGGLYIPAAVCDSPSYWGLSPRSRDFLQILYRKRAASAGPYCLPLSELRNVYGISPRQARLARDELVEAGFVLITQQARGGTRTEPRVPYLYKILL